MILLPAFLCVFLCVAAVAALRKRWTAAAVCGLMAVVFCLAGLLLAQSRQRAVERARLAALRKRVDDLERREDRGRGRAPKPVAARRRSPPSRPNPESDSATPLPGERVTVAPPAIPSEAVPDPQPQPPGTAFKRLAIKYPKPLFVGAPRNLMSEHELRNPWVDGGTMLVPVSTHLLSRGRSVTAGDVEPIVGELSYVTDGDKEGGDGSYVELGPGPQSIRIDLADTYHVHAVVVWHYHAEARAYHDVAVLLSGATETNAPTVMFNNDADDSLGFGEGTDAEYVETARGLLVDAGGLAARYVWLYSNGSTASKMNHYIEVEVYGAGPLSPPAPGGRGQ